MIDSFPAAALFIVLAMGDAKDIGQYDQMDVQDQVRYENILIKESALLLFRKGNKEGVKNILGLFSEKAPGSEMSSEHYEFLVDLNGLRDMKNSPAAPHVEHAMIIALGEHGIDLPS